MPADRPLPAPDTPPFRPRPPWWGGDLQTLRNTLVRRLGLDSFELPGEALTLAVEDGSGDRLIGALTRPARAGDRPLAVLLHGLTGCHDSGYMVETARHLLLCGYPVLRLNMRGAGPSATTCGQRYHAGRGRDVALALAALDPALLRDGVVLVGYSLGGSILLNFLAGHAGGFPVRAAATVSTPLDLMSCSRRIHAVRNRLYHRYLLNRMKNDWAGAALDAAQRDCLRAVRSIYAFDDRLVAPANGFGSAAHYYEACSARRLLDRIETPTLIIQSADDPWIPAGDFRAVDWPRNAKLAPLLSPGGGHVGFHARDPATPWHNIRIGAFFAVQAPDTLWTGTGSAAGLTSPPSSLPYPSRHR